MPNTASAAKMTRVAERRRLRNRSIKTSVKTFIKKAEAGIAAGASDVEALLVTAVRSLDKAATKGVLHRRNAARRKSRLMKKLNAALAAPVQSAEAPPKRRAARSTGTGRTTTRARATKKS